MATEIEMKLAFSQKQDKTGVDALRTCFAEAGLVTEFKESRMDNIYFDTADFALNRHKIALRIRRKKDHSGHLRYIQTLKTAGASVNGLSRRGEWEWVLDAPVLDKDTIQACEAWPADVPAEALVAIFETNFTRFAANLTWKDSQIEVALDWGEIVSNKKQLGLHEIELELKAGQPEDLRSLATLIQTSLPVFPFDTSKAERGFALFKQSMQHDNKDSE